MALGQKQSISPDGASWTVGNIQAWNRVFLFMKFSRVFVLGGTLALSDTAPFSGNDGFFRGSKQSPGSTEYK